MNSEGHEILFQRVLSKDIQKTYDKGDRLYLSGDAIDVSWDMNKCISIKKSANNPNIYTIYYNLKSGYSLGFKILNKLSLQDIA